MAPAELGGRRLRLLKEAVPKASRVGPLWNPADMQTPLIARDTERVARAMGMQFRSFEVLGREGLATFDQAFEAALTSRPVDALIAVEDYLTFTDRTRIVSFAAMSRLPAIYGLREFVEEAGGLMSYGTDRRDLFRRSATYVHRIFNGARPANFPVEPPTTFELAINLETATGQSRRERRRAPETHLTGVIDEWLARFRNRFESVEGGPFLIGDDGGAMSMLRPPGPSSPSSPPRRGSG